MVISSIGSIRFGFVKVYCLALLEIMFESAAMWRILRRPILLSAIVSVFLLTSIFGQLVKITRQDAEKAADAAAANLADVITREIVRTIETYDLSLGGVLEALEAGELDNLSANGKNLMLFDRSAFAPYLSGILVSDSNGDTVYDSRGATPRPLKLADQAFFQVHRDSPNVGLYISEPFRSPTTGSWVLALSRRITRSDGSFGGIVVGSMRLGYFYSLVTNLNVGPHGVLVLLNATGTVLARKPFNLNMLGTRVANGIIPYEDPSRSPSRVVAVSPVDGVERIFNTTHVGNYPLVLSIALATDDVFAIWRARMTLLSLLMLALVILSTTCVALLVRAFKRREVAEEKLRGLAIQLHAAAMTDQLTGTHNRRAFDERLEEEWQRALRVMLPLTCLMIDVDFFKAYNDVLGHLAGDEALKAAAAAIASAVKRPGDFLARFGGEEFVVLLPATDVTGAFAIAEDIRARVLGLALPHPTAQRGLVTVSIGLAEADFGRPGCAKDLVAEADAALYAAKADGRNCTRELNLGSGPISGIRNESII